MIARAHRSRTTSVFHLLLICAVLTPRSIVSPTDLEAPASHKAAQSLDSPTHAAIAPEQTTIATDVEQHSSVGGAEAADSLRSSSNVGAEAATEPLSSFVPPQHPASGLKPSVDLSDVSGTVGDPQASSLPGKTPGIVGDVASALIGHVVNVSNQAGNHSSAEASAGIPPEGKPGQPSQAQTPPKKPEEDEERHNFALAKDGAKIVAANKEARKPESILDSDGDTFLKNECKADKWVIIELSQVTKIDMIRLSQDELYSSRIRDFEVYGRQNHPRAEGPDYGSHLNASAWQLLGAFTAANIKGTQAFHIDPPGWAKFIQLRLLTHFGNEPVCALNDVRVYGKSAAEDLEDRLAMEAAADDEAAAQEECSPEEGTGLESSHESQQQAGSEQSVVTEQPQSTEPVTGGAVEERHPEQKGTLASDSLPAVRTGHTELESDAGASQEAQNPEAAADNAESKESNGSAQVQPASGSAKGTIPPVLDILGEGLMRLIVPPGAGKKRSAYSGEPTDPLALPQPDPPTSTPELHRSGQKGGVPERETLGPTEGAQPSGEPAAGVPGDAIPAKPAPDSATSGEPGSKKQDEAGSGSNGSRKPQKEERTAEKDGDLLLAGSSAGSAKSRHGGSVYDLLVAEIKALKLQQKTVPRVLGDMQKNVTLAIAAIASEVSALHRRVSEIEDSSAIPAATCAAALPGSGDNQIRVYPNSTAEHEAQHSLAHAESRSGPVTVSFDAMTLALELAALRSASERASRREFALVMVIVMLCAILALSLPQLASQSAWLRSVILLLAVANGFFGILLHFANSLQPEKSMFTHMHRLLGA